MKDVRVWILIVLTAILIIHPLTIRAGVHEIRFGSEHNPFELDGRRVILEGYLSLMYPVKGDWAYLVDQPYRDSPFYATEGAIFNGILIKPAADEWIDYTELPIRVTGRLRVTEGENEYGYPYYLEMTDISYEIIPFDELSSAVKAYHLLAERKI